MSAMATITVAPTTAPLATVVTVHAAGLDPEQKYDLTTVDSAGTESGRALPGWSEAQDRPAPDGTIRVGIRVPPLVGPAKVRVYQGGTVVAETDVVVAVDVPRPAVPTGLPTKLPSR